MKIINKIDKLIEEYHKNSIIRNNGTVLLRPGKIPKARHILFKGLTDEEINTYLISEYEHNFPKDYETFLKFYNGVDLFFAKVKKGNVEFATSHLTVYGLPRTKPFGRKLDNEEPFDVRIEDTSRNVNIPNIWLKFGSYKRTSAFGERVDLFIDTVDGHVYSCNRNDDKIISQWNSFDECLCEIFDQSLLSKEVYVY